MEFSLGRDTLPSQARSVRGESRRLRRERDNAKKLFPDVRSGGSPSVTALSPYCDQYSAQTGEPPLTLSLSMITCQGTTQARKSNEHISISASASVSDPTRHRPWCRPRHEPIRARTWPRRENGQIAAVSLEFAASPLAPQPDWLYGSFPWPREIMPHW